MSHARRKNGRSQRSIDRMKDALKKERNELWKPPLPPSKIYWKFVSMTPHRLQTKHLPLFAHKTKNKQKKDRETTLCFMHILIRRIHGYCLMRRYFQTKSSNPRRYYPKRNEMGFLGVYYLVDTCILFFTKNI